MPVLRTVLSMEDMRSDRYIKLYSKTGVIYTTLAFFGVMYLINLISWSVGNWLKY